MIERTIVAALVVGFIGFGAFYWMIANGWEVPEARNVLLLLMVLFENFHIGNCRSETKSAFTLSPLRSPMLLTGALAALLIHVAVMNIPFMTNNDCGGVTGAPKPASAVIMATNAWASAVANNTRAIPCGWKRAMMAPIPPTASTP